MEKSCEKYKSYDPNVWSLEFFDPKTGGYVVVNRTRRKNAIKYKNEGGKYEKEFAVAKVFAQNGHAMEMLEEISRIPSPDVTIDGIPADMKSTYSIGNIERYAIESLKKQHAKIVLFRLEEKNAAIEEKIRKVSLMGIHGKYFFKGENIIFDF